MAQHGPQPKTRPIDLCGGAPLWRIWLDGKQVKMQNAKVKTGKPIPGFAFRLFFSVIYGSCFS
ncbi:MAG TPA: hypothetical protein VG125_21440, partial [Pirellulales bacterium]|nr:hypothetical protein [Pirellulales bacterium]